jgi:hypothetical protein
MSAPATTPLATPKLNGNIVYLLVLVTFLTSCLIILIPAYYYGRTVEDKRQFLVNYRDPNLEEYWIGLQMDYVLNSTEYNDILFQGDSSCRYGVDAKLFEDQTELKAFNIGTTAWIGWPTYSLMVERYLEKHPKPRAIVFCVSPFTISDRDPLSATYQDRMIWSFGSGDEETRPKHENHCEYYAKEGIRSVYGSISPKERRYRGDSSWEKGMSATVLSSGHDAHRGGFILEGVFSGRKSPDQLDNLEIKPYILEQFNRFAVLAQQHNILLIVRLMPFWKGTASLTPACHNQLKQLEQEFGNVMVIHPDLLGYDPGLFYDDLHLNDLGVAKLTSSLATEIKVIMRQRKIAP